MMNTVQPWLNPAMQKKSLRFPILMFKTGEHYDGSEPLSGAGADATLDDLIRNRPLAASFATPSSDHDVTATQPYGGSGNRGGRDTAFTHDSGAPDDENDNRNHTRTSDPDANLSEVIPGQTGLNLIYSGGDDQNLPGVHDTSSRSSDNLSYLVDHGEL